MKKLIAVLMLMVVSVAVPAAGQNQATLQVSAEVVAPMPFLNLVNGEVVCTVAIGQACPLVAPSFDVTTEEKIIGGAMTTVKTVNF